jgi:N-acetylglutamate synthase-like GNAT family acetyltransferase
MEYIRKATPADAERIRFIAEECWWLASSDRAIQTKLGQIIDDLYSPGRLTTEIVNNISVFLLVLDGELAVAFTSYTFKSSDGMACELNALYCLPETQGKRFDELLVNEVIKNSIAVGRNKIFVVLTNYNGPVGLFQRLGFERLKTNDPEAAGSKILVMGKKIK